MQILDGKKVSEDIKNEIAAQVQEMKENPISISSKKIKKKKPLFGRNKP